jgi:hypothetical protein
MRGAISGCLRWRYGVYGASVRFETTLQPKLPDIIGHGEPVVTDHELGKTNGTLSRKCSLAPT